MMKKQLFILLGFVLTFVCGYIVGSWEQEKKCFYRYQSDDMSRDTVIDTIPYYQPVPVDSVVVRYEKVKLPVAEPTTERNCKEESEICTDTVFSQDSAKNMRDSVSVEIPITQKHYSDTTYDAWVSGYHPSLDSIFVYQKTETVTMRAKPKRWGVGIQGGYGYTPKGFLPYVGLGFHFSIFP